MNSSTKTRQTLQSEIEMTREIIDLLKFKFKTEYGKEPYSFTGYGASSVASFDPPDFTEEEETLLEIHAKERKLAQAVYEKDKLERYEQIHKYLNRKNIWPKDLVEMFPDDLKLADDYYDDEEDY